MDIWRQIQRKVNIRRNMNFYWKYCFRKTKEFGAWLPTLRLKPRWSRLQTISDRKISFSSFLYAENNFDFDTNPTYFPSFTTGRFQKRLFCRIFASTASMFSLDIDCFGRYYHQNHKLWWCRTRLSRTWFRGYHLVALGRPWSESSSSITGKILRLDMATITTKSRSVKLGSYSSQIRFNFLLKVH